MFRNTNTKVAAVDQIKMKDLCLLLVNMKKNGSSLTHEKVLQEFGYKKERKKWFTTILFNIFPDFSLDNQLQKIAEMDPESWGNKTLKEIYTPIINNEILSKFPQKIKLRNNKSIENIKMKDLCLLFKEYRYLRNIDLSVVLSRLGYSRGESTLIILLGDIFPNIIFNLLHAIADMDPESWGEKTLGKLRDEAKQKNRLQSGSNYNVPPSKKRKTDPNPFNTQIIDLEDGIETTSSQIVVPEINTTSKNFAQDYELFGYEPKEAPEQFDYSAFITSDNRSSHNPERTQVQRQSMPIGQNLPSSMGQKFGRFFGDQMKSFMEEKITQHNPGEISKKITSLTGGDRSGHNPEPKRQAEPVFQDRFELFGYEPKEAPEQFDYSAFVTSDNRSSHNPEPERQAKPAFQDRFELFGYEPKEAPEQFDFSAFVTSDNQSSHNPETTQVERRAFGVQK